MKNQGCLFLVIAGITVLLVAGWYVRVLNQFDTGRKEILRQCENALPIFKHRYQAVGGLLALYEKRAGWENGVFKGNPNNLNLSFEDAQSDVVDTAKISPELQYSQAVSAGLARLNGGGSPLENYLGALEINDNLKTFIAAASKYNEISTSSLLGQLKTDLAETDAAAGAAAEGINAAVEQFNASVTRFPNRIFANQYGILPISPASGGISVPIPPWTL